MATTKKAAPPKGEPKPKAVKKPKGKADNKAAK